MTSPAHTLSPPWDTPWFFDHQGPLQPGSEAHKRAFCRMLLDTHDPYKPAAIDWPDLAPAALDRIRAIPFWTVAVETEDLASAHISALAAQTSDPLIKDALDMMAAEEQRHRRVLDALLARYEIPIVQPAPYAGSPWVEWAFMSTGYGECLDSFFAFGLFELARRSGYFPPELVETFEPVIQEEARHIVFFANWVAYTQAQRPLLLRPVFMLKRLALLAKAGIGRSGLAMGDDSNFAAGGKDSIDIDIELGAFIDLCLSENERRMSVIDPRLLRPQIMPWLARLARRFIKD